MQSLALGPLALSMDRLLILLAVLAALFAGWVSGRRRGSNPESALFSILILALLGARLSFVIRFSAEYLADPWQIIDIRDGGFWWLGGLVSGLLAALFYLWRQESTRRPLAVALITGALVWGSTAVPLAQLQRSVQGLPAMQLPTANGQVIDLQAFAGRPLVINVWASWCPPCIREMPVLAQAQHDYPGVSFMFANLGEDSLTVSTFLQQQNLDLQLVVLDQYNQLGQHYGSRVLPTTLFIDAAGQLQDSHIGELSAASLKDRLAGILPRQ